MTRPTARAVPPSLDGLLPHAGRSRLIARVLSVDDETLVCEGVPTSDPAHPLRVDGALETAAAVEYGAQAMAIHGALVAADGEAPRVGYLVAVRELRFGVDGLDGVAGRPRIEARRVLALGDQVSYEFSVRDARGTLLADGRASVSLRGGAARKASTD